MDELRLRACPEDFANVILNGCSQYERRALRQPIHHMKHIEGCLSPWMDALRLLFEKEPDDALLTYEVVVWEDAPQMQIQLDLCQAINAHLVLDTSAYPFMVQEWTQDGVMEQFTALAHSLRDALQARSHIIRAIQADHPLLEAIP